MQCAAGVGNNSGKESVGFLVPVSVVVDDDDAVCLARTEITRRIILEGGGEGAEETRLKFNNGSADDRAWLRGCRGERKRVSMV